MIEGGWDRVLPSMTSTETKGLVFYYFNMLKATFTAANYAELIEPGYTKPYRRLIEEVMINHAFFLVYQLKSNPPPLNLFVLVHIEINMSIITLLLHCAGISCVGSLADR